MPSWTAWNWRLHRCLVVTRPARSVRLGSLGLSIGVNPESTGIEPTCGAAPPRINVPSRSRLSGALPLRQASGQHAAQRSNTPVVARNSAKNTNWPCGVAAAPSSQRTCMRPPSVSTTSGGESSSPPPRRAASALCCVLHHPSGECANTPQVQVSARKSGHRIPVPAGSRFRLPRRPAASGSPRGSCPPPPAPFPNRPRAA